MCHQSLCNSNQKTMESIFYVCTESFKIKILGRYGLFLCLYFFSNIYPFEFLCSFLPVFQYCCWQCYTHYIMDSICSQVVSFTFTDTKRITHFEKIWTYTCGHNFP